MSDLDKLKGHVNSHHPTLEGHKKADIGSVRGNTPHHDKVRGRDSYKSKGDIKPAAPLT